MLADEPTANLDPKNTDRVLGVIDQHIHSEGMTLVVVSHDQQTIERFDDEAQQFEAL